MEAPPLERKLVAILAADVEGYSRLMGFDEEGTLETLSAFRTIIDTLIARHGGRICGTAGDSVLAEFASVSAAAQCSIEIQRRLARANQDLPEERRMRFRIGVNVGDVMVKNGDIFGDGVNIATRLESLAEPGGICISRGVHDHVMRKANYRFEDLGEKSVKNIAQPIRVFRLIFDLVEHEGLELEPLTPVLEAAELSTQTSIQSEMNAEPAIDPQSVELMFWDTIKQSARAADFEAYLEQYPEGNFVTLARTRLTDLAEHPVITPQDREVELLFWESVRNSENPSVLRAYMNKYPEGEFKMLAEIRLIEINPPS